MASSEPTSDSSVPPKTNQADLTTPPPLPSHDPPIPPPERKNRTLWIITLISLFAIMLVAGVSFALFKIIAPAEALQIDKDIQLPVAENPRRKEKANGEEYALNLKWENGKGVFQFLEKDYEDEPALIAELAKQKAANPHFRVIVRGDKRLPAMEIQRAMRVLSSAGLDSIEFSTLDQE